MENNNYNYWKPLLLTGFFIWLVATIAFRVAGQYFFITENKLVLLILYIALIPSLAMVSVWVFKKFRLVKLDCVFGGVLLVLPGMILDSFAVQYFAVIFPNMPPQRASTFGSWLMLAYAVVLLTGIVYGLGSSQIQTANNNGEKQGPI